MSFLFGSRSNKTFKPKKNIPEGTHQYDLMRHAAATLGSGNLRLAVMLPEGEDLNEWVAVNTVDFFNQINMLYGTITEFCTEESCAVMSAGPKYEYHWADGHTVKKPIKCSAPKYIDYLMTWAQDQLDDETLFPSKIGVPFPKNFLPMAKTILKRLFRVYAHIYHQHFPRWSSSGRSASQHLLQTLHLLCAGVQPNRTAGAGAAPGADRETHSQGGAMSGAGLRRPRPYLAAAVPRSVDCFLDRSSPRIVDKFDYLLILYSKHFVSSARGRRRALAVLRFVI
ncbi:hypothetical protein HW555_013516 [Spodoptera exigua]|uniref:MOB kinase activator-like 1 n=1 Tax=Spodoptera exigua TaxID=7107 RepID=A0A835KWX7_SPOEX|nr:hypothetical protein HW555_013516 [Spodoptera exigua]